MAALFNVLAASGFPSDTPSNGGEPEEQPAFSFGRRRKAVWPNTWPQSIKRLDLRFVAYA